MLVLGGLALGFIPGLPDVRLNPDLVLLIFLPPLLIALRERGEIDNTVLRRVTLALDLAHSRIRK